MANPLHDALLAPHEGRATPFLRRPDGTGLTHAAFLDRAVHMAAALAAMGLVPGDRVASLTEKSADALALYAACLRGGFVVLPLNPAATAAEARYFLEDSEAALLVCDPLREGELRSASGPARLLTLAPDGTGTLSHAASRAALLPPVPRGEDDLAALLYTSGTTGRPKGAMLTQGNLLSNARALTDLWRFTDRDVLLHALPIFHTHGLFVAVNVALLSGAGVILMPRFDAAEALRLMPQATAMMGVPTFYTRLLAEPGLTREAAAHMRLFVSGSAPLLPETHEAFAARTGHRILERYGMTETSMTASNPYDGERRPGAVGFPLPGVELRIAGPDGASVPQGEIGVLEVRGPNVFCGYWRQPDKTAAEFRADGFFVTGDLARIDAEGYLWIVGRAKDLVISGGFNLYPREIEAVLDRVPGVRESAVVGVPHPDLGEAAVAVLACDPGSPPDREAVRAALDAELARYKHPRHVAVMDELPRNAMGKVQKAVLRERFAGLFARPGGEGDARPSAAR
jgi:malonyl-CoA/methylmalonyl-CoA synthetase